MKEKYVVCIVKEVDNLIKIEGEIYSSPEVAFYRQIDLAERGKEVMCAILLPVSSILKSEKEGRLLQVNTVSRGLS